MFVTPAIGVATGTSLTLTGGVQAGLTNDLAFGATGNAYGYTNAVGPRFDDATTGFRMSFNVQSLTGNRTFTWPNTNGTVACLACAQTFSAAQSFSSTVALTSTTAASNLITQGAAINIAGTSTDGIVMQNTTAATVGVQQYSPRLRLTGSGWKTTATAAAQVVDWIVENQPVQGAANPTTNLVIASQVNAGGYTARFGVQSDGAFGALADSTFKTTSLLSQNGMGWYRTTETNPRAAFGTNGFFVGSDGQYYFTNTAANASATSDTGLARIAAAVVRFTNGSTGAGSLVLGTSTVGSIGPSGVGVLAIANGTAPSSSPADEFQLYSADWNGAGTATAFLRNEEGTIYKFGSTFQSPATTIADTLFASLPATTNGTILYCSDCAPTTAFVNSTCVGSGTGSLAIRLNGAWKCTN